MESIYLYKTLILHIHYGLSEEKPTQSTPRTSSGPWWGHRSHLPARNGGHRSRLPARNGPYTRLAPSPHAETQYGAVMAMVRKLDSEMSEIRTVCERLLCDNGDRDRAMYDLTGLVKKSLPQPNAFPATSTPYQPTTIPYHTSPPSTIPYQHTSTPYQPVRDHGGCDMSTPRQPPSTSGEQTRLPAGGIDTAVQQQVTELAVLVQTLPGSYRCAWLEWQSEGLTAGFQNRWDSYECSAGAGWWWTV